MRAAHYKTASPSTKNRALRKFENMGARWARSGLEDQRLPATERPRNGDGSSICARRQVLPTGAPMVSSAAAICGGRGRQGHPARATKVKSRKDAQVGTSAEWRASIGEQIAKARRIRQRGRDHGEEAKTAEKNSRSRGHAVRSRLSSPFVTNATMRARWRTLILIHEKKIGNCRPCRYSKRWCRVASAFIIRRRRSEALRRWSSTSCAAGQVARSGAGFGSPQAMIEASRSYRCQ